MKRPLKSFPALCRLEAAGSAILAAAVALASCSTGALTPEEAEMIEQRRQMIRQNELQLQRLKNLQDMTEAQFLEMELKGKRAQWAKEAAVALQERRFTDCTALIEKVFSPPPREEVLREPVFENGPDGSPSDRHATGPDGKAEFKEVRKQTPYPAVEIDRQLEASMRSMYGTVRFEMAQEASDPAAADALIQECMAAYKQAQQIDPQNSQARRNLGRILFQQARRDPGRAAAWYEQALSEWQGELARGFRDAELMILVGQALFETGRKEAAARAFEIALPEMPDNEDLMKYIALAWTDTGRTEEAVRVYDVLLSKDPFNSDHAAQKAFLLSVSGRQAEALSTLESLVAANAMRKANWNLLGDLYAQAGLPGPAADALLEGGSGETGDQEKVFIADLLTQAGRPASKSSGKPSDYERALEILRSVKAKPSGSGGLDTDFADAMFAIGRLFKAMAQTAGGNDRTRLVTEGIESIRSGLAQVSTNGQAWLALGDMAFSLGQKDFKVIDDPQLETALAAYTRASALPESCADGWFGAGDVHFARGQPGRASECYKAALEARPDDQGIAAALASAMAEAEKRQRN